MNQQQLESLSKAELNRALTPFMGGYTKHNLKNTKHDVLVDELTNHLKEQVTRPKRTGEKRFKKCEHIIDVILEAEDGITMTAIVESILKHEPEAKQTTVINYIKKVFAEANAHRYGYSMERKIVSIDYDKEAKMYKAVK